MKGIVFVEFLQLVEEQHGLQLLDAVIEQADLGHDGAYTAVGTYHHSEMIKLVQALSDLSGVPVNDALRAYGQYLLAVFTKSYPEFFSGISSSIAFLSSVNDHIHVEVRKLYPDAELPSIQIEMLSANEANVSYRSSRPLAYLALGLVEGCLDYFDDGHVAEMTDCDEGCTYCVIKVGGAS